MVLGLFVAFTQLTLLELGDCLFVIRSIVRFVGAWFLCANPRGEIGLIAF